MISVGDKKYQLQHYAILFLVAIDLKIKFVLMLALTLLNVFSNKYHLSIYRNFQNLRKYIWRLLKTVREIFSHFHCRYTRHCTWHFEFWARSAPVSGCTACDRLMYEARESASSDPSSVPGQGSISSGNHLCSYDVQGFISFGDQSVNLILQVGARDYQARDLVWCNQMGTVFAECRLGLL